ncbi:MAG: polysaccharide biosynthesis protein [Coriobacteriia bacterium]|nr:polysaccharide biosynthesis protein [Coriobacteriia bacterium]
MSDRQSAFARVRATGRLWNGVLVILDIAVIVIATVGGYYARFEGIVPPEFAQWTTPLALAAIVVYVGLFALFGLYRLVLRYVGVDTLLKLSGAVTVGAGILVLADALLVRESVIRPVPLGVLMIQALLVFLGASAVRMAARIFMYVRSSRFGSGRRVLIVGGGSAGSLLLREIQSRPDLGLTVIGFLDDRPVLRGRTIGGVHVLGATSELERIVAERDVQEIMVAMPSAPRETVRRILNEAADSDVQTRIMPALVIAKGSVSLRDLRGVDVEDLLGREPTRIDVDQVRSTLADKVVAVTGAAGSIGSELCRQIMAMSPAKLLLIEIDETRLYELWLELRLIDPQPPVMCVCDIRDVERLDAVFGEHRPDVVLHAAAYKHVPLMEIAPAEAIKTNVLGTLQVIEACERHDTERFVLISTDKAVAPANIMGLTKSLAEREMLDATRRGKLHAVAVRFGNVLASRGSVVPIFQEQLRHGGPLTVTHPDVTRYFMTIPEASRLVLQAQAIGEPGDIFVLEMGEPVKIVDLARKMIALSGVPADVEFSGLRPGEKLHETLVTESETLLPTERDKILRVERAATPDTGFDAEIRALIECALHGDVSCASEAIERLEPGFAQRERA